MTSAEDGGPAFPSEQRVEFTKCTFAEQPQPGAPTVQFSPLSNGMSLRDYFAAKAMAALIPVCSRVAADRIGSGSTLYVEWSKVVEAACEGADRMLKELAK